MKFKYNILILMICVFFIPYGVKADKIYTTITGNDKISSGENIKYTVILDNALTEYSSEITYDRNIFNLVSVDEVKIDTETKSFSVEKDDPIKINITSNVPTIIVYTITFDVKKDISVKNTTLDIKTITSSTIVNKKKKNLTSVDQTFEIEVLDKDDSTIIVKKDNSIKNTVGSLRKLVDDYWDIVMYVSLGLNLVLIICLICSLKRKKMDYDF